MRVRIRDVVAPVFWPVHRAIARGTVQELVAKGGRGSGKSSYISIELVFAAAAPPQPATRWCCARSAARCAPVCMRRSSGPLER